MNQKQQAALDQARNEFRAALANLGMVYARTALDALPTTAINVRDFLATHPSTFQTLSEIETAVLPALQTLRSLRSPD